MYCVLCMAYCLYYVPNFLHLNRIHVFDVHLRNWKFGVSQTHQGSQTSTPVESIMKNFVWACFGGKCRQNKQEPSALWKNLYDEELEKRRVQKEAAAARAFDSPYASWPKPLSVVDQIMRDERRLNADAKQDEEIDRRLFDLKLPTVPKHLLNRRRS